MTVQESRDKEVRLPAAASEGCSKKRLRGGFGLDGKDLRAVIAVVEHLTVLILRQRKGT